MRYVRSQSFIEVTYVDRVNYPIIGSMKATMTGPVMSLPEDLLL